jgi:methylmalonyl-CoA/ethylmalonyl-CoA epimerase
MITHPLFQNMKMDHIGIAVNSIEEAMQFYSGFDYKDVKTEVVTKDQVKVAFLPLKNSVNIELLEPLNPESPVAKFIQKRGTGIHHICLAVENIEEVLKKLKAHGVQLIDEKPRQGAHHCMVAFVHPKSTGGVLLELSERMK